MKVTIARALTLKKRLIGKINVINSRIQSNNSVLAGSERAYNVEEMIEQRHDLVNALIGLKVALQVANGPILADIFRLSEAKTEKGFYEGLNVNHGKQADVYSMRLNGGTTIEYNAVITQSKRDQRVAELEEEIDQIQQKLDRFNNMTEIEVPDIKL